MNYKSFLYAGIFTLVYSIFLIYEKPELIKTKSVVTKVKQKNTVINNINGLDISEIQSNADVIYKVGDETYETNINVSKNQPLQIGNVIPIEYNRNEISRKEKGIPDYKYWILFTLIMFSISYYLKYYYNVNELKTI